MTVRKIEPSYRETKAVAAMVDNTFGYYGGPYWGWKYDDALGPPGLIVVAEVDGEVVGCNHYLAMDYHLGGRGSVPGLAAGDLVVAPDRRRRHLGSDLSLEGRSVVAESWPEAILVAMFTWRSLGVHYEKLLGYTRVVPGYREWSKRLTWDHKVEQLAAANEDLITKFPRLAGVDHGIRFELKGSPPLELRVDADGFRPEEIGDVPSFELRMGGADLFPAGRSRWRSAVAAAASGRLRLRGSPRAMQQALSVAGAYVEVVRLLLRR